MPNTPQDQTNPHFVTSHIQPATWVCLLARLIDQLAGWQWPSHCYHIPDHKVLPCTRLMFTPPPKREVYKFWRSSTRHKDGIRKADPKQSKMWGNHVKDKEKQERFMKLLRESSMPKRPHWEQNGVPRTWFALSCWPAGWPHWHTSRPQWWHWPGCSSAPTQGTSSRQPPATGPSVPIGLEGSHQQTSRINSTCTSLAHDFFF